MLLRHFKQHLTTCHIMTKLWTPRESIAAERKRRFSCSRLQASGRSAGVWRPTWRTPDGLPLNSFSENPSYSSYGGLSHPVLGFQWLEFFPASKIGSRNWRSNTTTSLNCIDGPVRPLRRRKAAHWICFVPSLANASVSENGNSPLNSVCRRSNVA